MFLKAKDGNPRMSVDKVKGSENRSISEKCVSYHDAGM